MSQPVGQYLQTVKELETTLYTQNELIKQLTNQYDRLGIKKKFEMPERFNPGPSQQGLFVFAIIAAVVSFAIFATILTDGEYLFGWIWAVIKSAFFALLVMIGAYLLAAMVAGIKQSSKEQKQEQQDFAELNEKIRQDDYRVSRENILKERISQQANQVGWAKMEIEKALQEIYDMNVIHPKYRNLVAVSSFCEYFETGRCDRFEGHDGAYNIFEQEIRFERVFTKMDTIISKLDDIKDNQSHLYHAIQEANQTLSRIETANREMARSLDTIQQNQELIEYNTRCSAASTQAIGDMLVLQELLHS